MNIETVAVLIIAVGVLVAITLLVGIMFAIPLLGSATHINDMQTRVNMIDARVQQLMTNRQLEDMEEEFDHHLQHVMEAQQEGGKLPKLLTGSIGVNPQKGTMTFHAPDGKSYTGRTPDEIVEQIAQANTKEPTMAPDDLEKLRTILENLTEHMEGESDDEPPESWKKS